VGAWVAQGFTYLRDRGGSAARGPAATA